MFSCREVISLSKQCCSQIVDCSDQQFYDTALTRTILPYYSTKADFHFICIKQRIVLLGLRSHCYLLIVISDSDAFIEVIPPVCSIQCLLYGLYFVIILGISYRKLLWLWPHCLDTNDSKTILCHVSILSQISSSNILYSSLSPLLIAILSIIRPSLFFLHLSLTKSSNFTPSIFNLSACSVTII